jgi:hypothetical protein
MISPSIRDEVLRELERLDAADQERVRDFLRALSSAEPRGTPGAELTRFAGALHNEALKLSRRFAPRSLTPARYQDSWPNGGCSR